MSDDKFFYRREAMKDIKTLIILIMCSVFCMAAMHRSVGGAGTYQSVVSDDGMTLIVVDTSNGDYKVCDVGMMHRGGAGTYQAAISDDGMTLVVVDTRNGGYKVCDVELGDYEKELFDARERVLQNWGVSDSRESSLFKFHGRRNLLKPSGEPSLFKSPERPSLFKEN
jgi:hypothetical protein